MIAVMPELDTRHVVGGGAQPLRGADHLVGRHEEERRFLVDESTDELRAGDTIDTGPLSSDPFHGRAPSLNGRIGTLGCCRAGTENVADPGEAAPVHATVTLQLPGRGSVMAPI